jgi:predicted ATPase
MNEALNPNQIRDKANADKPLEEILKLSPAARPSTRAGRDPAAVPTTGRAHVGAPTIGTERRTTMRAVDVPQAFSLAEIRRVVERVAQGRDPVRDPPEDCSSRQAAYRLHAARVLGLVADTAGGLQLTSLGRDLSATDIGSDAERSVYRKAIEASPILRELAPGLLSLSPPSIVELRQRIQGKTGLAEATAEHRARGLLSWARQVQPAETQFELFSSEGVREASIAPITELTFNGFKSLGEAALPLGPLTVLVGPNAAGKSNAIEGIRTLQRLARSQRLDDLNREVHDEAASIRGTPAEMCPRGENTFELGCLIDAPEPRRLRIQIRCAEGELHLEQEELLSTTDETPVYVVHRHGPRHLHQVDVVYAQQRPGGFRRVPASDLQPVFMQFLTPAPFAGDGEAPPIWEAALRFRDSLSQISFLDPDPRRMRGYAFETDRRLKADGSNVSSVLYDVWQSATQRERLLSFIRSLPEQNIRTLEFARGPKREVMVKLVESFGGSDQEVDATLLSDGTLRVLAIAASLLSATAGSLVVVEEVDNGVHPDRSRALIESIRAVAVERGLKVLLTTHNPALLDALPLAAVRDVVYCYRDPQFGHSRLVRLQDADQYPDLVAQGSLGELITRGVVERMFRTPTPPEERVRSGLEWLKGLRDSG